MKSFIVNSKDLADKRKNPHFSLSPSAILKNERIEKEEVELNRYCYFCGSKDLTIEAGVNGSDFITCSNCERTFNVFSNN